ncbi:hypothetical protein JHK84_036540 [Glycine max]|uniref:Uncharacterized protein n=1 Tax=Glycine max TaxID=3847 RepID=C6SW50_SOYBN|nr:unknown [Glycine max]KAG5130143.1 hypothetical protein JHK84_036540 [Glycine max]
MIIATENKKHEGVWSQLSRERKVGPFTVTKTSEPARPTESSKSTEPRRPTHITIKPRTHSSKGKPIVANSREPIPEEVLLVLQTCVIGHVSGTCNHDKGKNHQDAPPSHFSLHNTFFLTVLHAIYA